MKIDDRDIYPLTIISDRYNGSYSGARFLAFNLNKDDIPDYVGSSDGDEMVFWSDEPSYTCITQFDYVIGKGYTVQDAFDDLYNKIHKS